MAISSLRGKAQTAFQREPLSWHIATALLLVSNEKFLYKSRLFYDRYEISLSVGKAEWTPVPVPVRAGLLGTEQTKYLPFSVLPLTLRQGTKQTAPYK